MNNLKLKLPTNSQKVVGLTLLSLLLFTAGIGSLDIYSLDEVKNAEAAREMIANNNFLVPTFNGIIRTDKPPLHYYFMAASYAIFGVNEFSARFFSALMGIFTVLLVYFLVKKNISHKAGFYTALLLLASLHFNIQMHMAVPDPYLIFFITLSGAAFYLFYEKNIRYCWWIFYGAIGLGMLTKGPVALVLIGIAVAFYLLVKKEFSIKNILRINPFLGIIISLLIALPWFLSVHQATGGVFTEGFFLKHNIQRFHSGMEGHGGLFLLTLVFVSLGLLPFLFFIFRFKTLFALLKTNTLYLWSACFALTIVVFFMISGTKLPNYTVPAYPWLFVLLSGIIFETPPEKRKSILLAVLVFSVLLPVAVIVGLRFDPVVPHLYFLGSGFFIITIGAVYAYVKRKSNVVWMHSLLISWYLLSLLFFYVLYPKIDSYNPVSKTRHLIDKKENIVGYKAFNPAFVFNFKKIIPELRTEEELQNYIDQHPEGGKIITRANAESEAIIKKFHLKFVAKEKDIFERPTTLLLEF